MIRKKCRLQILGPFNFSLASDAVFYPSQKLLPIKSTRNHISPPKMNKLFSTHTKSSPSVQEGTEQPRPRIRVCSELGEIAPFPPLPPPPGPSAVKTRLTPPPPPLRTGFPSDFSRLYLFPYFLKTQVGESKPVPPPPPPPVYAERNSMWRGEGVISQVRRRREEGENYAGHLFRR